MSWIVNSPSGIDDFNRSLLISAPPPVVFPEFSYWKVKDACLKLLQQGQPKAAIEEAQSSNKLTKSERYEIVSLICNRLIAQKEFSTVEALQNVIQLKGLRGSIARDLGKRKWVDLTKRAFADLVTQDKKCELPEFATTVSQVSNEAVTLSQKLKAAFQIIQDPLFKDLCIDLADEGYIEEAKAVTNTLLSSNEQEKSDTLQCISMIEKSKIK